MGSRGEAYVSLNNDVRCLLKQNINKYLLVMKYIAIMSAKFGALDLYHDCYQVWYGYSCN